MTPTIQKVVAYVTRGDDLLVFEHVHEAEAGVQVPAGTVQPGEDLREAVQREAREETGLLDLTFVSYLGSRTYDARASHDASWRASLDPASNARQKRSASTNSGRAASGRRSSICARPIPRRTSARSGPVWDCTRREIRSASSNGASAFAGFPSSSQANPTAVSARMRDTSALCPAGVFFSASCPACSASAALPARRLATLAA